MEKQELIKQTIRSIAGEKKIYLPFTAKVVSVEGVTCTIQVAGGLKVSDVRLKSSEKEGQNYELRTPVVGSNVTVVSHTGLLDNLSVIQFDEVEKYEFVKDGLSFTLDNDKKVSLKNEQISLLDLFQEIKNTLTNFSVLYVNPAGAPTPTVPDPQMQGPLNQLEVKFKQLLK